MGAAQGGCHLGREARAHSHRPQQAEPWRVCGQAPRGCTGTGQRDQAAGPPGFWGTVPARVGAVHPTLTWSCYCQNMLEGGCKCGRGKAGLAGLLPALGPPLHLSILPGTPSRSSSGPAASSAPAPPSPGSPHSQLDLHTWAAAT